MNENELLIGLCGIGVFLACVCMWLWNERKQRIEKEQEAQELIGILDYLRSILMEAIEDVREANENLLKNTKQARKESEEK